MREILFRGKRISNGEWVNGGIIQTFHPNFDHSSLGAFLRQAPNCYCICSEGKDVFVEQSTIGQFTGLTDKNGKKIFEGDIGKYNQTDGAKRGDKPIICIGKVIYNAKTASYAVESQDDAGCKYFDYFTIKDFEVIGNIHDNPELLKGERENEKE